MFTFLSKNKKIPHVPKAGAQRFVGPKREPDYSDRDGSYTVHVQADS